MQRISRTIRSMHPIALILLLALSAACGDDSASGSADDGATAFGPSTPTPGAITPTTGTTPATPATAGTPTAAGSAGAEAATPTPPGTGDTGDTATENDAMCPATAPAADSTCMAMGFISCDYDTGTCRCARGSWACDAPPDPNCPDQTPDDGSVCTTDGTTCEYRRTDCECSGGEWVCDGGFQQDQDGGTADTMGDGQCPASEPADDSTCAEPNGTTCDYGGTSCGCFGGAWRC